MVNGCVQVFPVHYFRYEKPELKHGSLQLKAEPAFRQVSFLAPKEDQFVRVGFQCSRDSLQPAGPNSRLNISRLLKRPVSGNDLLICRLR
jgi:hypothetical protein